MKNSPLRQRFGFAWAGIVSAWRREPSFRLQLAAFAALVFALIALRPAAIWWALCLAMALLVLAAELFNTALESLIDHLHPARGWSGENADTGAEAPAEPLHLVLQLAEQRPGFCLPTWLYIEEARRADPRSGAGARHRSAFHWAVRPRSRPAADEMLSVAVKRERRTLASIA